MTPSHVLRKVMEQATTYAEARAILTEHAMSTPAIFTLAGLKPNETCVIERTETEARVHDGANVAANHWQSPGWTGHARGGDSAGRAAMMHRTSTELDPEFPWLKEPVLNPRTRIVMVSDASAGQLVAQGFEKMRPATLPLDLSA
jgi:hypothetical protein